MKSSCEEPVTGFRAYFRKASYEKSSQDDQFSREAFNEVSLKEMCIFTYVNAFSLLFSKGKAPMVELGPYEALRK